MNTAIAIVALATVIAIPALAQQGSRYENTQDRTVGQAQTDPSYDVYVNGKYVEMWACTRLPAGSFEIGKSAFDVCEFLVETPGVEPVRVRRSQ